MSSVVRNKLLTGRPLSRVRLAISLDTKTPNPRDVNLNVAFICDEPGEPKAVLQELSGRVRLDNDTLYVDAELYHVIQLVGNGGHSG